MPITERILCPFHPERTPSCVIYENGFKCFSCGKAGSLEELGRTPSAQPKERYIEDVKASIARITSLPLIDLRGLQFHADSEYYYVLWPDHSYYNARRFDNSVTDRQKYKCPAGVPRPLYHASGSPKDAVLVLCEGEINALSIAAACPTGIAVASPGGASEFAASRYRRDRDTYRQYERIVILADKDKAGAIGAIQLKAELSKDYVPSNIYLMEKDSNDILTEEGKEALKAQIEAFVAMSSRMPTERNAV